MSGRGSDVLKERYASGGFTLDDDVIAELVDVVDNFELRDVFIKGIPRPDFLRLTVYTEDIDRCGTVVRGLTGILGKRAVAGVPGAVKIFPRGIPWPDAFSVQFDIGAR